MIDEPFRAWRSLEDTPRLRLDAAAWCGGEERALVDGELGVVVEHAERELEVLAAARLFLLDEKAGLDQRRQ
eukprot:CAMPEP_0182598656 /NCGR_PEP_ID=MMETSP1324-20130603/88695_1 /TAXON_ID=236786 /ORGANISM="Florenciella sp., Strain RCC1587" /LENGTH=71 /DNA_ID=CAMNT_0024816501 /DNA_START=132 /DNA_END=344 /DNA_ORIENTATION=-